MIVVDTNVIVYLQVQGNKTAEARAVFRKDPNWIAPVLWRSEFRNTMTLFVRRQILSLDQAVGIVHRAERAMIGRERPIDSALVLKLAATSGCSAYDCEYVSLAQDLGVPLVTADTELLARFGSVAVSMQAFCSKP